MNEDIIKYNLIFFKKKIMRELIQKQNNEGGAEERAALNPTCDGVVTTACSKAKITSLLHGLLWDPAKNILGIMLESNDKSVRSPEQKHMYIVAISPCDRQQPNIHEAADTWKLLRGKS